MATNILLILGTDSASRRAAAECVAGQGRAIHEAQTKEGLEAFVRVRPHLLIVEREGAAELLGILRSRDIEVDTILLDAKASSREVVQPRRLGAFDILAWPGAEEELESAVDSALEARIVRETTAPIVPTHPTPVDELRLVGSSEAMWELRKMIGRFAPSRIHVLVRGETGTGKELVARALHTQSPWKSEPFIAVNVPGVADTLIGSELFGHVRGAFTGAARDRQGAFELAGRGSIFLDEIASASHALQATLLRVLQTREFRPLGSQSPLRSMARVIAATNEDLERMVARGSFRGDLLYRLQGARIAVPPLRERKGDIAELAGHMLKKMMLADEIDGPLYLSPGAHRDLLDHSWPGNVRELEQVLHAALLRQRGRVVLPGDLDIAGPYTKSSTTGKGVANEHAGVGLTSLTVARGAEEYGTLKEMEKVHVLRTLMECGGNISEAARRLDMKRSTLVDRMKKLLITRDDFDPRCRRGQGDG